MTLGTALARWIEFTGLVRRVAGRGGCAASATASERPTAETGDEWVARVGSSRVIGVEPRLFCERILVRTVVRYEMDDARTGGELGMATRAENADSWSTWGTK
jgi:hypothetical protein